MNLERFFTLWILIWILLYRSQLISFNPTLFLLAANTVHIAFLLSLEANHNLETRTRIEIYGITILFLILHLTIPYTVTFRDTLFGFVLFIVYLLYISIVYKKRFADIYIDLYNDQRDNKRVLIP